MELDLWTAEDNEHEPPRAWKNTDTGTILCVRKDEDDRFDGEGEWMVSGQNTVIYYNIEILEEARKKAIEYMMEHPNPSPMV